MGKNDAKMMIGDNFKKMCIVPKIYFSLPHFICIIFGHESHNKEQSIANQAKYTETVSAQSLEPFTTDHGLVPINTDVFNHF